MDNFGAWVTVLPMKSSTQFLEGIIGHSDLEGGFYTLTTSQGMLYKLEAGDASLYQIGRKVRVEGQESSSFFGIGFGTPVFRVKRYQWL